MPESFSQERSSTRHTCHPARLTPSLALRPWRADFSLARNNFSPLTTVHAGQASLGSCGCDRPNWTFEDRIALSQLLPMDRTHAALQLVAVARSTALNIHQRSAGEMTLEDTLPIEQVQIRDTIRFRRGFFGSSSAGVPGEGSKNEPTWLSLTVGSRRLPPPKTHVANWLYACASSFPGRMPDSSNAPPSACSYSVAAHRTSSFGS